MKCFVLNLCVYVFFTYFILVQNQEAWKYEKIYESAKVIQMEGFNSPFQSRDRDIALDSKRLKLEEELGKQIVN